MIVDLRSQQMINQGKVLGYEINSLFKSISTNKELHTANTIQAFELDGTICNFDLFVLKHVANKIRNDVNKPESRISINISAKSLSNFASIMPVIQDIAQYLILEITETALTNIDDAKSFIAKARLAGAKVALDDLNHSSQGVSLVESLRPDVVKFVYPEDKEDFKQFIDLVKQVSLFDKSIKLVIENIETEYDFNKITAQFPKAFIQGHYLDKGTLYLQNLRFIK